MNCDLDSNWVEVDLAAVRHNVTRLVNLTGKPLMGVVKANAYGHGVKAIVPVLISSGVTWLGVARIEEAINLREEGCQTPILVFGPVFDLKGITYAIEHHITLTLTGYETALAFAQGARLVGAPLQVHLKVDTGLGRLGILPDETLALAKKTRSMGGIEISGIYSHFAMADEEADHPLNQLQIERFTQTLLRLEKAGFSPETIHLSNSGSLEYLPQSHFNLCRAGSTIYGLTPTFFLPFPEDLQPALSWKSRVVSCKQLPDGWGVGYGQEYVPTRKEFIAVIAVGYADGFRRAKENFLLIGGKKVPVVGRVNMDFCTVALNEPVTVGTEVVIIGRQGTQSLSAQDHADRWNTIDADVTSQINQRVPRVSINQFTG